MKHSPFSNKRRESGRCWFESKQSGRKEFLLYHQVERKLSEVSWWKPCLVLLYFSLNHWKLKVSTVKDKTWTPDVKNWLLGKDPDAEKDWRREEKGTTEDEVVGWHHWLDGHEFEQAPGVGDGQGRLACHSPWGHKELDTAELNWTEKSSKILIPNVKTILKNKFAYLYFYINANIS